MEHSSYLPLLLITGLAVVVPVLASRFRGIPIVVGEILAGIIIGRSGLDWVQTTPALQFLAEFGFTFLMFLSGLEVDLNAISNGGEHQGPFWLRPVPVALGTLALTVGMATAGAYGLQGTGVAVNPLLLGLILSTTSLGVVLPVLKEQLLLSHRYGQYLLVIATVADFVTLLALTSVIAASSQGLSLDVLLVIVLIAAFSLAARLGRRFASVPVLRRLVEELSHATAQIRVRGALALMVAWVVLAEALGVELILGSFLAGAVVGLLAASGETYLRVKLDAIGFGFFIPIFFIKVGVDFNLAALMNSREAMLLLPVLVALAYAVKLLPALVLTPLFGLRDALAGGFLLSSRLSLIIAASAIALKIHAVDETMNAAVILVAVVTCTLSPAIFNRLHRPPSRYKKRRGIVITGSGQMAQVLARRLLRSGAELMVVSDSATQLDALRAEGIDVLYGNPTDEETLRQAGAARAEALVALCENPDRCLAVSTQASEVWHIPLVVAQANDLESVQKLQGLGVRVVQPSIALAVALEGALRFPTAFDVLVDQDDDVEFGEAVLKNPSFVGVALRNLRLPGNALVLSISRDGTVVVPHGDTVVELGDHIALIGSPEAITDAAHELGNDGLDDISVA